jgi:hypothetical protein
MPAKRTTSRTRSKKSESFEETPRLLSSEEKRQLILAHAKQRAPKDPVQQMTMWAGVAVAVLAIAGGWMFTVGHKIQSDFHTGNDQMRQLVEQMDEFTEETKTNPC